MQNICMKKAAWGFSAVLCMQVRDMSLNGRKSAKYLQIKRERLSKRKEV